MVDAKQSETEFYPGSGRGAVRPAVVCSGHYIAQHRVPVVGLLQTRRERKRGLQVPGEMAEDIMGELEGKCAMCRVLLFFVVLPCVVVPRGEGVRLPFIGQGESELHVCRTIQLHGEVWCAAP
jgi:hypothetical protein